MGNALHLGTFLDIPVRIHWTFGLLLGFAAWSAITNGLGVQQSIGFMLYIFTLFLCVVLHEYGHALAARRFGIRTRDIILSPIGGIARLEKLPQQPIQEFFIAIAGPLVNVVIGSILAIIVLIFFGKITPELDMIHFDRPVEFLRYVVWVNFALFLFNLIPAFPMDGGRILRSLLAIKFGKLQATKIASGLGRIIAVVFIIIGVLNQQLILSLIGIFIFMMAGSEFQQIRLSTLLKTTTAGQIMKTDFSPISADLPYMDIIRHYKSGEHNFLVFDTSEKLIGAIPELFVKDVIKSGQNNKIAGDLYTHKVTTVSPDITLEELIALMKREGFAIVGIEPEDGKITGVLDRHRIEQYLQFKGA